MRADVLLVFVGASSLWLLLMVVGLDASPPSEMLACSPSELAAWRRRSFATAWSYNFRLVGPAMECCRLRWTLAGLVVLLWWGGSGWLVLLTLGVVPFLRFFHSMLSL